MWSRIWLCVERSRKVLLAENISKRYRNNRRTVLDQVDFKLEEGEFCAVMGESGSGKSTLLAVLSGILRPDSGKVLLDDADLYALSDKDLSYIHQRKIGYVPQANIFLKQYTILDNIVLPYLSEKKDTESELYDKAKEHLEKLGIGDLWDRYPYELSGGEQKRACLIRALLMQPKIVIADEPTTGLDAKTGEKILTYLDEYKKFGRTVLVATHDDHVKACATRVWSI